MQNETLLVANRSAPIKKIKQKIELSVGKFEVLLSCGHIKLINDINGLATQTPCHKCKMIQWRKQNPNGELPNAKK